MLVIRSLVALLPLVVVVVAKAEDDLRTVAEKTDFKATATHADVMTLCKKLEAASQGIVTMTDLGTSTEGRVIPLMIVADPPVKTPEEAKASGKLVALVIGNIHAGEVDGKEAIPMLVREIIADPNHPLRKDLILLLAPIYNADGNEKFAKTNRPGQIGPEDGMGVRHNGQGLDLNRDFVKLEAPETQGLLRVVNAWDPHVFMDLHTTNGSYHRYEITYQGPKNPAGDPHVLAYVRDVLMPEAGKAMERKAGYKSFFYGNFDRDHTLWTTYGATPRFGTTYMGLRNRISVLSEAYSYVDFKTRVLATLEFTRAVLEHAVAHKAEIVNLLDTARTTKHDGDAVAIRSEARVAAQPVTILGYVEATKNGRSVATKEPRDYRVGFEQDFVPTMTAKRPHAYLVPATFADAILLLKRHGLDVKTLSEDTEIAVEVDRVDALEKSSRPFEGHRTVDLKATSRGESRVIPKGTAVVSASGPLGALAVYLLDPRSDDGLATWNVFDDGLEVGKDAPVLRVMGPDPLPTH